jgi:hypothetical protein
MRKRYETEVSNKFNELFIGGNVSKDHTRFIVKGMRIKDCNSKETTFNIAISCLRGNSSRDNIKFKRIYKRFCLRNKRHREYREYREYRKLITYKRGYIREEIKRIIYFSKDNFRLRGETY